MSNVTAREKYNEMFPNSLSPLRYKICPSFYNILPDKLECQSGMDEHECTRCWDREIPEEKEIENMHDSNNCSTVNINFEAKCAELMRENEKLRYENKELKRRLEKYELVVRAVETLCGQKIITE